MQHEENIQATKCKGNKVHRRVSRYWDIKLAFAALHNSCYFKVAEKGVSEMHGSYQLNSHSMFVFIVRKQILLEIQFHNYLSERE